MKILKSLLVGIAFIGVIFFSSCSDGLSSGSFDIIVKSHLSEQDQGLISSYIWNVFGADTRIGIASVKGETAFSLSIPEDCVESADKLLFLRLKRSDNSECVWETTFDESMRSLIVESLGRKEGGGTEEGVEQTM